MKIYYYNYITVALIILLSTTTFAQHLDFDGSDDNVSITSSGTGILGDFSVLHDFTVEGRFVFTGNDITTTYDKKIFTKQGLAGGWYISTDGSGKLNLGYWADGIGWLGAIHSSSVALNTPIHFAMVYEVSPLRVLFYVDGVLITDYPLDAWGLSTYTYVPTTENTMIATSAAYPGKNGQIAVDYVRVWNTSRSTADLSANKDTEVSCSSTGLVAQYKLEDGTASSNNGAVTTISNCVGGGFDGALNNLAMTGSSSNFVNNSDLAVALPVEFTKFEAEKIENNVQLFWQTATEKNNEGFEIERSADGITWEVLDFVPGYGTTQEVQNYSYTDEASLAGTSYYRLKQVDFDGKYEYSDIVNMQLEIANNKLEIFPNPVSDKLNIINGQGIATIYNVLGQPVRELIINNEQLIIDVKGLPKGQYIMRISQQNGNVITQQFLK